MTSKKHYNIEIWNVGGTVKIGEMKKVLRIQHLYDETREHITRLIIDTGGGSVVSKELIDLELSIVTYMEAESLQEIDNELNNKIIFIGDRSEEEADMSIGDMISEKNPPEYIEIRGFQSTEKKDMIIIENVLKVQNYSSPMGKIKRIIYEKEDKFCFAEFIDESFTFIYCSTRKTLEELDKDYASKLENPPESNSSKIDFSDALNEEFDEYPYDENKVNQERPIGDNKILFG